MEKSHSFLQTRYKFEEIENEGIEYSASEQNVLKTHEMNIPISQRCVSTYSEASNNLTYYKIKFIRWKTLLLTNIDIHESRDPP